MKLILKYKTIIKLSMLKLIKLILKIFKMIKININKLIIKFNVKN